MSVRMILRTMEVVIGKYTEKFSRLTAMSPGSRPSGRPSMIRRPTAAIPRPRKTRILPISQPHHGGRRGYACLCGSDELDAREEVRDLVRRRVRRVGSVRRVALDRLR